MCGVYQGFKFRFISIGMVEIFRSILKIETEHVIKNFVLYIVLFRSELSELPESGRNSRNDRNRGINFSVLKFICLFYIFLY